MDTTALTLHPIGELHCRERFPYDVPRQGSLAGDNPAVVTLYPNHGYAEGLRELEGFSHIWLLFWFHHNSCWHPLIRPPRHRRQKVGVFASRSPYRPNPLGLSCVRLVAIEGSNLIVKGHDLLDGTPVLDIKPYLPYADAFPNATLGWTAANETETQCLVKFTEPVQHQLLWLDAKGVCLKAFLLDQLSAEPLNGRRHRLEHIREDGAVLAYRTWRARFDVQEDVVTITALATAYSPTELASADDPYGDKDIHRQFIARFL